MAGGRLWRAASRGLRAEALSASLRLPHHLRGSMPWLTSRSLKHKLSMNHNIVVN